MSLEKKIIDDLKVAMKAKDELRLSCLRMLKTAIKNKSIEIGSALKDEEIHGIIASLVRKGREAAKEFHGGGREDLAIKEEREIDFFYGYLPKQLTSNEIKNILREIISEASANDIKDLGKVMKIAMNRMAGKAQGKEVNEIARKILS